MVSTALAHCPTDTSKRKNGVPEGRKQPQPDRNRQPELFKWKPGHKEHKINSLPLLERILEGFKIDNKTSQFFKDTWRPSTRKCYISKEVGFMGIEKNVTVLNPSIAAVLKYLSIYFEKRVG